MRAIVIALALLAAAPARAAGVDLDWRPPDEFDGPYYGRLTVHFAPLETVNARCAALHGGPQKRNVPLWGCAQKRVGSCTIILPKLGTGEGARYVTERIQAAVRRHEMGHCNGWKHGDEL